MNDCEMTIEEAYSCLTRAGKEGLIDVVDNGRLLPIAIMAVGKQVPYEPTEIIREFGDRTIGCPRCESPIGSIVSSRRYQPRYCHLCGQALDWEAEK